MNPIPILHIKDSSGLFGSERVILTLARNIDRRRFDFHLLCMRRRDGRSAPFIELARRSGIQVVPVDVDRRFDGRALKALRGILRDRRIAILHAHDYKSDLYGLLGSLNLPLKRVLTSHGSTRDSRLKRLYLDLDERLIYPRYDRIVAVSAALGRTLSRKPYLNGKVRVIPNGLDADLLRTQAQSADRRAGRPAVPKEAGVFLTAVVGRLFPDKGHRYFLEALERLRERHPGLKALIVGDGPEKEALAGRIRAHHLEDAVRMCGFVADMPAVYRAIDCLVMPSLTEGLPYTLLEAMNYGVPVIATAVGDIPDLIRPGRTGVLIPPAQAEAIVNALEAVIRDPASARRLAEAGRRLVQDEYSAASMARHMEKLYLELTTAT
ncbi:MAG: glycosyltransferase family 4 protein [Lentisphaeria bacterium]|jgi:glycosyltransferase involved in cell wall biosynthesis|nr:glycosyltransferase family 4 protein [Lentisphaeria bacterium]